MIFKMTKAQAAEMYRAAIAADAEWMRQIAIAFPNRRPGDVRYTTDGKGSPGSALRAAYDNHMDVGNQWLTFLRNAS